MANLSVEERIALINENLAEVMNPEFIDDIMIKQGRYALVPVEWKAIGNVY